MRSRDGHNMWSVASEGLWKVRIENPLRCSGEFTHIGSSACRMLQHGLWPHLPWRSSLCQWTEVEYWRHPQYVSDTEPRAISSYRDTSSRLSKPNLSPLKASEMQPYTAPMGNLRFQSLSSGMNTWHISLLHFFLLVSTRCTVNTRGCFKARLENRPRFLRLTDSTRGSYIMLSYWS